MHALVGQSKGPMPACAQGMLLEGVEQVWQAEETGCMVGKLVILSNLFKTVSKYIEDNDKCLSIAEGIDKHRKMGWLEKAMRY